MKSIWVVLFLLVVLAKAERNYTDDVLLIKSSIENPNLSFRHAAFNRLAYITDTFGPRLWGSNNLQLAIKEMLQEAVIQQFDNIRLQPVNNFTRWARGSQSLELLDPRPFPSPLKVIGLGGSVSGNVTAEVIVFQSFEELEKNKDKINGKVVVYNNPWVDYGTTGAYRVTGVSRAAKYGAVASLVRSVTPKSIQSVHTGYFIYEDGIKKIPAAAISVEDAQMFQRMHNRGQKIVVRLSLESQTYQNWNSSNLIFEIKGSTYPDQIILAGGHIDSWDTGSQTGANDDGGGFITVFEALRLLKRIGLRPKRTIRFIAWSGEEFGVDNDGAAQYNKRHAAQLDKHVLAFESDEGSTQLYGFGHTGQGTSIVKQILNDYLSLLNAGQYEDDGISPDTEILSGLGVPVMKNLIKDTPDHEFYFTYHHSAGDSMSIMNPEDMDSNVAGIAALLYIVADLDTSLRQTQSIHLQRE